MMTRRSINVIEALLDGLTGAGLFRRLRYPGAPMYAIDPRSPREILEDMPGRFGNYGTILRSILWQRDFIKSGAYKTPQTVGQVEHETESHC